MTRQDLFENIQQKKSFLCIGLDTDIKKIPPYLLSCQDPIFEFNKQIIDATKDLCVAYKINSAFYEAMGVKGWESMVRTFNYIPENIFTIADAKRGDIGNTSSKYAQAFFDPESSGFNFDAITAAPYMGEDSITPFLEYKNKWVILLALTSNKGAADFQMNPEIKTLNEEFLYQKVIKGSMQWGNADNMMYVIGATHRELFLNIRTLLPNHFLLVPGIGAQGGTLKDVAENGLNKQCGLLVNVSRSIIYASQQKNFGQMARMEAETIASEMKGYLSY
ncbi:MAG: orotidine-5'-phosphate decarboxylase [Chitinophagales bacterium]|nr:orotidine-5'-phosphate decarboxylase [Chitinophagales bacterium]